MRKRLAAVLVLFCAVLPVAQAAGLGKLTLLSALGQPLDAEVEIVSLQPGEEGLSARLASPQAFAQAGIEPSPILSDVRFAIERRGATPVIVRLRSSQPVYEPFLTVLVELTSSTGSRVRESPSSSIRPGTSHGRAHPSNRPPPKRRCLKPLPSRRLPSSALER